MQTRGKLLETCLHFMELPLSTCRHPAWHLLHWLPPPMTLQAGSALLGEKAGAEPLAGTGTLREG